MVGLSLLRGSGTHSDTRQESAVSIRIKIVLVVLPLLIVTLVMAGISSYFAATTGITRIAREFLDFKAAELEKYAYGQYSLLAENGLTDRPEMVEATKGGVSSFAQSIIRSDTELILAFDDTGKVTMRTGPGELSEEERTALLPMIEAGRTGLLSVRIDGIDRVARGFPFAPFGWYLLLTEQRDTFYRDVDRITWQTIYILVGASLASVILLLTFVSYLTRPLKRVVGTMRHIISNADLSERVQVEYRDEIGQLAHTFNIMIGELEKAYTQIKSYAFKAVLAQKKEAKIRNIFQKYVPQDLIDRFFKNPESMLVGDNRVLSILFSDIRSFTTISEGMAPDDLVSSLNRYFSAMVDIIMNRNGIVDKYIGDAIMAFFGAPVKREDDALQSVLAALEMIDALKVFNRNQTQIGKPEFHIGIGINYGIVTVGNIGSERKMDYTVIGDMVNIASRLEGLTKQYHQQLVISESLHMKVHEQLPCRLIDTVQVKGKTRGLKIYTTVRELGETERRAWDLHDLAMSRYYERDFPKAKALLEEVRALLVDDYISDMMIERCDRYIARPPEPSWNGVEVLTSK